MTSDIPKWRIPSDIVALVAADDDLTWTTDDWAPLKVSVIGGTAYAGREIHLAWQVELDPSDTDLDGPNEGLADAGLEPDGYAWAERISTAMSQHHPELADQLHFGDTEESTCVVWVESEATCQRVVETIWTLVHGGTTDGNRGSNKHPSRRGGN